MTNDSTPSSAVVPTYLTGNATSTYWNAAIVNTGDDTTEDTFDTWVSVDGFINFKAPNPAPIPMTVPCSPWEECRPIPP